MREKRLHRALSALFFSPLPGQLEFRKEDGNQAQGGAMRRPHVDDFVRLTRTSPNSRCKRGEVGVVRSTWFAPSMAYEVEFHPIGLNGETRALLLAEQVQVEEGSLFRDESLSTRIDAADAGE
jgi:hypothetical protein